MTDPLAGSPWSSASTVEGFVQSPPNDTLLRFARGERERGALHALDIGCGAARNTVPLARQGWHVLGIDLALPMIAAAAAKIEAAGLGRQAHVALAPMNALPVASGSVDLLVAHGIWNLARTDDEFRDAVREAARTAKPGAALFVFTFSRQTLPEAAPPVAGESFIYTQFSGQPQCFLTEAQLIAELEGAGFTPDPAVPLTEHNLAKPRSLTTGKVPVIYEAAFRFGGGRVI